MRPEKIAIRHANFSLSYYFSGMAVLYSERRRGGSLIAVLILLGLIAHIVVPDPLAAQAPVEAEVEFYIESAEPNPVFTIGDQITLHLEIIHPSDSRVVLPQVEEQWEAFTVVEQTAPQTVDNGDGTSVTSRNFVVALFQPGEYQTPLLVVTHRKPDGSVEELATPVIPIAIVSVLTEEDTELRDLKGQIDLPVPAVWPWLLAALLGSMLLLGLLTGLALWLYHRRRTQTVPEMVPAPVIDLRPPEVIAYAELDRIQTLNLPAQDQIKEHYSLVATCLRRYIEGRYHISALEQTTTELRVAFSRAKIPHNNSVDLVKIVTESDFVKFARYRPRDEEINALIDKARGVVDATTKEAQARDARPTPSPPPPTEMKEVQV